VGSKEGDSVGQRASRSKDLITSGKGGVAEIWYRGLVYKGWEVEWYHACGCGITRSRVEPPT